MQKEVWQNIESKYAADNYERVGGGCINECFQFSSKQASFFVKYNRKSTFPEMMTKEAKALELLAKHSQFYIPRVIEKFETDHFQILILEYVMSGTKSPNFWEIFGSKLAEMHQFTAEKFGLGFDNYIGSLQQSNKRTKDGFQFFISERLQPQISLAAERGLLGNKHINQFELLYKQLPNLLPDEKPSLLHGDLWSGNFLVNDQGTATLVDPAVYFGWREAELAFTTLFGGFDQEMYYSYQEVFPLQKRFHERMDIYNLYPLLVHLNLFGSSYLTQIASTLNRFVS